MGEATAQRPWRKTQLPVLESHRTGRDLREAEGGSAEGEAGTKEGDGGGAQARQGSVEQEAGREEVAAITMRALH